MADRNEHEEVKIESLLEKISGKILDHHDSSSSSSDSDNDKKVSSPTSLKNEVFGKEKPLHNVLGGGKHNDKKEKNVSSPTSLKNEVFGREKPLHNVLDGGKPADIFAWRNKKISKTAYGVTAALWSLYALFDYHLLTLISHLVMLALAVLFLWSNASTFINKSPPKIPQVHIPEEPVLQIASAITIEINKAFAILRDIASGKDLRQFLTVIVKLWILAFLGSWVDFFTFFFFVVYMFHTIQMLKEEKEQEFKKQFAVFNEQFKSKIQKRK